MTLSSSLPMYALNGLQAANDALWAAVASGLQRRGVRNVPAALWRGEELDTHWLTPDLLLSQTCGYPLVTSLRNRVALLTTPCYRAPGCEGPLYRSAIVVREAEAASDLAGLRGRRCAVNSWSSNSGMNVLRAEVAPLAHARSFFSEIIVTGGHAASVAAVAQGRADVAAIDCVTWAHLQRLQLPDTGRLRVLAWTRATPGLPLITSLATSPATRTAMLEALNESARDPALKQTRDTLLLDRFEEVAIRSYDVIQDLERTATEAGYPHLV